MLLALDSNVFIAALSGTERHSQAAQLLLRSVASGKNRAVASSLVYGEVLSVSLARHTVDLAGFFASIDGLQTMPADDAICLEAGKLRKHYGPALKLPDALHVASALSAGVELFITNDLPLARVARKLLPTKTLAEWAATA